MNIQLSAGEIASAPALCDELARFGRLRLTELVAPELQPDAYGFNRGRADSWAGAATAAVAEAEPLSLVVCRLDGRATPSAVSRVYAAWEANRVRTSGRYVMNALAFSAPARSFQGIAADLGYLWDRAAAGFGGPASRQLGLAVVRDGLGPGPAVILNVPVERATAAYLPLLAANPVLSAEVMEAAGPPEPAYRRSNRLAAFRQIGLLIPLTKWFGAYANLKVAHARLLGRSAGRKRTLFYRSVLYDLLRTRGGEAAE